MLEYLIKDILTLVAFLVIVLIVLSGIAMILWAISPILVLLIPIAIVVYLLWFVKNVSNREEV